MQKNPKNNQFKEFLLDEHKYLLFTLEVEVFFYKNKIKMANKIWNQKKM